MDAGNHFELAIAVAIATFGVLIGLVYVALYARRYFTTPTAAGTMALARTPTATPTSAAPGDGLSRS
ncbi:hypothetical protein KY5_4204 [Streptomyces formicae]|uniref:Uncharacterized protein n=1 Tax=Streptomyces formicae TaxID=1616117 RepID=A0A291QC75_9ACTN|nr:hypothetical protein KY5_4204 [Streptomyces formicae]